MMILLSSDSEVVAIVLAAGDDHRSDDYCPLHPKYSKQAAAVVACAWALLFSCRRRS